MHNPPGRMPRNVLTSSANMHPESMGTSLSRSSSHRERAKGVQTPPLPPLVQSITLSRALHRSCSTAQRTLTGIGVGRHQ
ncbi:hypothetical protein FKP32DRAFT_1592482 [Trametes sanguinea]|nr:hypothetical protein FKP32DRAFT_1592482 [Trametes sanguinea]